MKLTQNIVINNSKFWGISKLLRRPNHSIPHYLFDVNCSDNHREEIEKDVLIDNVADRIKYALQV